MKATDIGLAEWLDALSKAGRKDDEGQTAEEMAAALGTHPTRVRKMLHLAQSQGRLVRGTRLFTRLDGRTAPIPVYRVLPKKGKK